MSKHILFLTSQLPYPPHAGGALRSFGQIEALAARGHRVGLLSLLAEDQPDPADTPLAALCDPLATVPAPPPRPNSRRLRDLASGAADMARRAWAPAYAASLQAMLAAHRFDVIQFESIEMAAYLPMVREVLAKQGAATGLVYDAFNAEYDLQARIARQDWQTPRRWPLALYSSIQAARLRRFEGEVSRTVDRVVACSAADAVKLAALGPQAPVAVVPNAIRTADYDPGTPPAGIPHPALVYTGKMDFRPNVDAVEWFAQDVLPLIRAEQPAAHFVAAGKDPHPRLDALRSSPGVTLTGFVPAIQPYLTAADVFVVPLRMGSGTRLKLLEAMAMGCAVVSTPLGAEGLDAVPGKHLLLADTAEAFAGAVLSLLADPARRRALGAAAASLARAKYDWQTVIPLLEAAYEAR